MSENKKEFIALFSTAIIWGSGFVAIKYTIAYMNYWWFIALRFIIASIALGVFFFKKFRTITRVELVHGTLLGIAVAAALSFQIAGCSITTVGKNAFLCSTYVMIIPFLRLLRTKKKITPNVYLAVFIALAGTAIISLSSVDGFNIGDFLSIISGFFWAIHMELNSEYSEKDDIINLIITEMPVASVVTLIIAFFTSPTPKSIPVNAMGTLLYTAFICASLGFLLQIYGQKRVNSSTSGIIFTLEAVFAGFFSLLLLDEKLTAKLIIGAVMIFVSVIISNLNYKKGHIAENCNKRNN